MRKGERPYSKGYIEKHRLIKTIDNGRHRQGGDVEIGYASIHIYCEIEVEGAIRALYIEFGIGYLARNGERPVLEVTGHAVMQFRKGLPP